MSPDSAMRLIVSGSQLPNFSGQNVSLFGFVTQPDGNSFTLRTADSVMVPVELKAPPDGPLEGYVEVIGTSQGKSVLANQCIFFKNQEFDEKSHLALCKMLHSVPGIWHIG